MNGLGCSGGLSLSSYHASSVCIYGISELLNLFKEKSEVFMWFSLFTKNVTVGGGNTVFNSCSCFLLIYYTVKPPNGKYLPHLCGRLPCRLQTRSFEYYAQKDILRNGNVLYNNMIWDSETGGDVLS